MNDMPPDRDDFIHRVFRHLRSGFSEIVVNLVDRVDKRLEIFIDDERHLSPDVDDLAVDALTDLMNVFSSLSVDQRVDGGTPASEEDPDDSDVES